MSTTRSNSSSNEGIRTVPGSGGGVSVASLNFSSSPAFILSPPPLPTPQTVQTITAKGQSTTPALSSSQDSRTPMTVQLQRLLRPTPVNTTPAVTATTPRPSTPSTVVVPATPSPHTIDQFLQQSGLPPNLSRTATSVVFTVLSWTLHIINLIACAIINRFKAWWNKVISNNFPNTADIIEALLEYTVEVCLLLINFAKFLSPYIVWLAQTLIAIILFLGGSFVCGIIVLTKGRVAAENSGAGEVQSSAMKSLNVSIQNSPFYTRKAVPFTPRFDTTDNDLGVASAAGQTAGTQNGTTYKSPLATTIVAPQRSTNKSTPPVSVMKRHSSYQSNSNTPNVAKPTPKTRRVLFSESQHGQVDTEQFFYDKTMPSARKLPRPNENRQQMVVMAEPTQQDKSSPANSATNTPVLRPSKFGSRASTDNNTQQDSTSQVVNMKLKQPNTEKKKHIAKQDDQNKQRHIPNYGHFPSITPLSKRCGRMKRQTTLEISSTSNNVAVSIAGNGNNNAKRKRRELFGAASRMGRRRLNNNRVNGSSLPVVLLGKNRKRQREEEQNRTDEWVWRAMNSDGEKENLDVQDGGATKRTKHVNEAPTVPQGLSTPPKKAFPAASTPPKTPGPSAFSFGSSTPAPKSKISATPAKTPLPSSSSNDPSSSAGFSFGNAASASGGTDTSDTVATPKDGSYSSFSFGSTPAKNKNASTISFGVSSGAPEGQDEKKDNAKADTDTNQTFSFGGTNTSVPASAQATPAKASFSFGSAGQMNNTPAKSASTANETKQTPSFSFGGTGETTPSSTFAFGSASQTPAAPTPAASETKQTPSFAFGSTGTSSTAAGATTTFSFGSATQTTTAAGAAPAFSFGGQPPGAGASQSNSISIGGSSSGASARRRAAASRRK